MLEVLQKKIQNTTLTFTNQRALFWEAEKILILSDLHVGKSAHFRKHGIAISSEVLVTDLNKLEDLINHFQPEKVIIVGDLFHAGYNSDLDLFKEWRLQFSQQFILIRGNHDKMKCEVYDDLGIECEDEFLEIEPFTFIHHPKKIEENKFYISGHIHPGFVLKTKNERLRLPCFAVSEQQIVLPAFSQFTGLDTKSLKGTFKNIVFTEGTIFEV
ncbi:ligase-associated DNA damage response endonuclease PdeM [Kaistella sp. G5-32]|uniref:Ligase-associated DNA damage response endonuclease PdeM n=1 Tax=Kaistella gelatinilytica TaxID=2787636 RepID=A0ABS0F959_9FLAO|nr:ligase-associated DNA damage response endonuclease PdeM [Kaistella gelatinilytica]MBF8456196.1 ligase-associated DNA damage response endonuclease PdeM [Kaistella gelatinilytica]